MRLRIHSLITMALSSLMLLLPAIVLSQQTTSAHTYPPLGELVDVGGRRLHVNCTGKGSPTVIMEAGAGDFSFDWSLVQPQVAKSARVCAYDRGGYAWSDSGPMPRTMKQIVYELHTGLAKAGIKPPYVFVGHSRGGLVVRVYAKQYPKEVAGMVLIDSSHENQLIVITDRKTKKEEIVRLRELSREKQVPPIQVSMPSPVSSLESEKTMQSPVPTKVNSPYDRLPLNIQQLRLWATSQTKRDTARMSETFDFLAEEMAVIYDERSKGGYSLGNMPLIVLTRGIPSEEEQAKKPLLEEHDRLQRDLATLSSNSKHIIAQKSGHHIQLDEPKLVIDAVEQVVEAVQRSSKLR